MLHDEHCETVEVYFLEISDLIITIHQLIQISNSSFGQLLYVLYVENKLLLLHSPSLSTHQDLSLHCVHSNFLTDLHGDRRDAICFGA